MSPLRVVQGRIDVHFGSQPSAGTPAMMPSPMDRQRGWLCAKKERPCPKEALKVLPVRHWGSQPSVWSIEGSLCSLVPMKWPEGCWMGSLDGSHEKETLSRRGSQSAACETRGQPAISLVKERVTEQFGPNSAAGGPSAVTP